MIQDRLKEIGTVVRNDRMLIKVEKVVGNGIFYL